jgi:pimeloyl-ACP methyl ester carboxylesterase
MPIANVSARIDGEVDQQLSIGYELIGDEGSRAWTITPGGRFSREYPGVRAFALALAELGNQVLIWDRPNTGESDVCFVGGSESGMQADVLAALLRHLGIQRAVITGGSGGARVSILTAARHPEVAAGFAVWWITGGVYGLMKVGTNYGGESPAAAWKGGMEAVVGLPEWREVIERNPGNRRRFLALDPSTFRETIERWMAVHCPCADELIPGLPDSQTRAIDSPSLVFQSGANDPVHTRSTSERLAQLLPNSQLVEPPWPDVDPLDAGPGRLFLQWPLLAPVLDDWSRTTVDR